jgi:hypothetical protein
MTSLMHKALMMISVELITGREDILMTMEHQPENTNEPIRMRNERATFSTGIS